MLQPREALIAGLIGLAIVYPAVYYAFYDGYIIFGLTPKQWKGFGTVADALAFAIPYLVVKWLAEKRSSP